MFRNDLTQINTYCWNSQGVLNHAEKLIASSKQTGPISALIHYGKDLGHRANTPIPDALKEYKEVENWVRLATVVFAASGLELFVRRAVRLSLLSDPGLLIGRPQAVDGVSLLKAGNLPKMEERVTPCTDGVWSARETAIASIFGRRIPEIFNNLSELQFLQSLRNSIGHDLARTARRKDFWYLDPEQAEPQLVERVSPEKVQNLLRLVGLIGEKLEETARSHIGSFELFQFWHLFKFEGAKPTNKVIGRYVQLYKEGSHNKLLSTFHHQMVGGVLGREYCRSLLTHYNRA